MFKYAITRKPCSSFAQGQTTSNLGKPDYELMIKQHDAYVETLCNLGLQVLVLKHAPNFPDAHFVEDTAIVTPDVAIIANPGAETRKGEEKSIEPVLAKYRKIERIKSPGTVDGGDVLMIDNHFFVGISERTNREGAEQLGKILEKYDNTWTLIPVSDGLHLKSGINYAGKNTLLVTEKFLSREKFKRYEKIVVDQDEEYAANNLLINDHLITPKGFPKTKAKLEVLEFEITELDMSEVRKMDGGLTCLSLRF